MSDSNSSSAGGGFGIGAILAVVFSWFTNGSVLWAIFHLFCGWFYVIYWMFVHWQGGWFTGWN
jgi:hypothetical protein